MEPERQLGLNWPHPVALGRDDFMPAPSNRLALAAIDALTAPGALIVSGPPGSGKTHLAAIWAADTGAAWITPADLPGALPRLVAPQGPLTVALDNADRVTATPDGPEALFHLFNALRGRGRLLMTAQGPARDWGIVLPDLLSRLATADHVALSHPDQDLLAAVMVKHFADRQIRVDPRVIVYAVTRMERSLEAARLLADRLDRLALGRGTPITRKLTAEVLDAMDKNEQGSASS